jgi:hypothetical protein
LPSICAQSGIGTLTEARGINGTALPGLRVLARKRARRPSIRATDRHLCEPQPIWTTTSPLAEPAGCTNKRHLWRNVIYVEPVARMERGCWARIAQLLRAIRDPDFDRGSRHQWNGPPRIAGPRAQARATPLHPGYGPSSMRTGVIYGETSSMIEPARAWRASWAMQK